MLLSQSVTTNFDKNIIELIIRAQFALYALEVTGIVTKRKRIKSQISIQKIQIIIIIIDQVKYDK